MPAASLEQAAGQSYDKLATQWLMNSLASNLQGFCRLSLVSFLDQDTNARPVANWLTVIDSFTNLNPDQGTPQLTQLSTAAKFMYKMLWLATVLRTQNLITAAQATALLAQFNAFFP